MSYSTSSPPVLLAGGVGMVSGSSIVAPRIWSYSSTDAVSVVRVAGYITNGYALGMRAGDLVLVIDNDASPLTGAWCWVSTATAGGSVDLSDGVTITGTNSD